MKKLVIALMAVLLLTGCAAQPVQTEPTLPPAETTIPTEPLPSIYVENSPKERGTGGAVKLYQVGEQITGLGMLGGNLLLCVEEQELRLYNIQSMQLLRTRKLEHKLFWSEADLVLSENGMAYYDQSLNTYVTLDNNLITASTYVIPESMQSVPVITEDFSDIYYASENGIRVMHLAEGTSRLLREEHTAVLSVDGLLFDDQTLYYTRRTNSGDVQTCFVDSGDGSIYHTADFRGDIRSWENHYAGLMVLEHALGESSWLITGNLDGELQKLNPSHAWENALILNDGLVVLQHSSQIGLNVYCYDLNSGELVSQLLMPEQHEAMIYGCTDGAQVWLSDSTGERLYAWNLSKSAPKGTGSVLGGYTSLDAPDEAGMDQCRRLASTIGERHGVEIVFDEENNRTSGVNYDGYPDYRPDLYNQALRELERVLRILPEDFLRRVGRMTDPGKLAICLVDDFEPNDKYTPATGSIDVTDGKVMIRVSMCENIQEIFLHELFHVLEVQIMNNSDGFEWWEYINPDEFEYVNSYSDYYEGKLTNSPYVRFGTNSFADAYSMISPREDRAQVFMYACMDDQSFRFTTVAMQKKLTHIRDMMRDCFGITDEDNAVWEQYWIPEEPEPTTTVEETQG